MSTHCSFEREKLTASDWKQADACQRGVSARLSSVSNLRVEGKHENQARLTASYKVLPLRDNV
jgi:hypothetical protein